MAQKSQRKPFFFVAISLLMLASITGCLVSKPPGPELAKKCGDGTCGDGENWKNCPKDCGKPITPPAEPPAVSGESRFGIHVGRLDLKSRISELGDIYSRINIGPDAYGWKIAKGDQASIDSCKSCCRELNCENECKAGYIYYCEPGTRDGIVGKDTADGFYADNYEILFSVSPGSYGKRPKDVKDLLSFDYPANVPLYEEYLAYLLEQYPDVTYWEVLNEADHPQFWGDTPENYVRLFTLTSRVMKSRGPGCKVGISLVGPDPDDEWFSAIAGVCDEADFLDLHQYHSETMDELREFEDHGLAAWKQSCPGVEIISTETGIPSEPFVQKGKTWVLGTSESKQAQDSIKYLTMMFSAGYSKIYYYLFDIDFVPGIPDMFEHNGLLNEDNSEKKAFTTYKLMIEKLDHFDSITRLAAGQYKYSFSQKDPVYVVWCDSGTCAVPSEISGTVRVTDYEGNGETRNANQITLTGSPVFIEPLPG